MALPINKASNPDYVKSARIPRANEAKRDLKVAIIRSMKAVLGIEPPWLSTIKTRADALHTAPVFFGSIS